MDLGHPQACEALATAAAAAGSDVVRGVGDVVVTPGASPVVRYELDDVDHELRCRLVVGADGRASSVRRQLGLSLTQTEPKTMGGGMLIEGLDDWPSHRMALGTEDDLHYLVFPREGGLARLYQMCPVEQKTRFTGPDRQREFLDSFRLRCLPIGEAIAASTPAGPCAMYPMNDSWTDRVAVPGVVLIGDAAGWNDPIIGEGLSIALRDARTVADVVTSGQRLVTGGVRRLRGGAQGAHAAALHRRAARDRAALRLHPRGPGTARAPSSSRSATTRCCSRPPCCRSSPAPRPPRPRPSPTTNIERILALG